MLSDVEKRNNLMLTPLTPVPTLLASHHKHMKLVKPFTHVIARSVRKGFWSVDL